MEEETWKIILDTSYSISNLGRVKNKKDRVMKLCLTGDGYHRISIYHAPKIRKSYLVHRLVAMAFIENPQNKAIVNHKDGNKVNNCVSNLEWSTNAANIQHCHNNLNPRKRAKAVLQCDMDDNIIEEFVSIAEASRETGAHLVAIAQCCRKQKHRITANGFKWKFKKEKKIAIDISEFVPIKGLENYLISRKGEIYSTKYNHLLSPNVRGGYKNVGMYSDKRRTYKVHILVAKTFLPDPEQKDLVVNHKDLNKLNNNVDNLEYITQSQNRKHYFLHSGEKRRSVVQLTMKNEIIKVHESTSHAVKELRLNDVQYIRNCCKGRQKTYGGFKWRFQK